VNFIASRRQRQAEHAMTTVATVPAKNDAIAAMRAGASLALFGHLVAVEAVTTEEVHRAR